MLNGGSGVLITGGNGQLGRAFRQLLPEAVVLGRDQLDITDRPGVLQILNKFKPAVLINGAAYTKVDAAEGNPDGAQRVNGEGPRNLAEACGESGSVLVQVSTDYVFSGTKKGAYLEDDRPDPASVYGKTKLEGEDAVAAAPKHLIVRTSWVFGDGQNFIRSILNAAKTAPELSVVEDQWGLPSYAVHLAPAILQLVAHGATGTYHLAGAGDRGNWAEVAELAITSAELPAEVRRVSTEDYFAGKTGPIAPRPANSVLDCSKAATLGVELPPWRQAIVNYVQSITKLP